MIVENCKIYKMVQKPDMYMFTSDPMNLWSSEVLVWNLENRIVYVLPTLYYSDGVFPLLSRVLVYILKHTFFLDIK